MLASLGVMIVGMGVVWVMLVWSGVGQQWQCGQDYCPWCGGVSTSQGSLQ